MPIIGPDNKPIGLIGNGQNITEANNAKSKLIFTVAGISVIALLCIIFIAIAIAGKIAKPIKYLVEDVMAKAEQGDLTVRGIVDSQDEIGQLTVAFNSLLEKSNP